MTALKNATANLRNQQSPNQSRPEGHNNPSAANMNQGGGYPGTYPPLGQGYPQQGPGCPQQGPGYPQQGPGYPQQGPGYPQQGPGYPQQGPGYPQQGPGYPQQGPGYPTGNIGFAFPNQPNDARCPPQPGFAPTQEMGYPRHTGSPRSQPQPPYQPYQPQSGCGMPHHSVQSNTSTYPSYQMPMNPKPGASSMSYGRASVTPAANFSANADAEALRKAMKGFGCDKNKLIAVLCARSNAQRQEIARSFKTLYGKDLISDLKSELHGDFEDLIIALMQPPAVYDAQQLRKAMQGLGTKESVLIELMCSRTNAQIVELKTTYRQLYGKELEGDLDGETSGCFKRLLVSLSAAGRDESFHTDPLKANQDARALYRAGEQRLGTDESCFNAILAAQNYMQLRMVFAEYEKVIGHPIEKAIEAEFSGDIRDGLMAVIQCVRNKPAFFAQALYNSMKGLGTRDNDLIRICVTRAEVDMADIRDEFHRMFNTSLEAMIKGDCSGSYKDGIIALVRGN
ncbi:hypothetical protein QR680_013057 [Steinernema hermaphroditum]|uniref:Annexin n=1 Tax=Steinernema hermaphroditum TaxID=289476 RepID=A0AA39M1N5_9BILA|nr:hypothetical protein QR680_013057 [Steinernema hermaphroditum]